MDAETKNFHNGLGFCFFGFAGSALMSLGPYLVPSMPRAIPIALLCSFTAMMGLGLVMIFAPERSHAWVSWLRRQNILSGPFILMFIGFVVFACGLTWQTWPKDIDHADNTPQKQEQVIVKSFRQVFDTDFPALGSLGNEQEIYNKDTGKTIAVAPTRLHYDYGSGSKFVSIFLPPGDLDVDLYVCMFYTRHIQETLRMDDSGDLKFRIESRQAGDSDSLSTDKFAFSNLIYIYALPEMKLEDKSKVLAAFREKGITAIFRGIEYYSHSQS